MRRIVLILLMAVSLAGYGQEAPVSDHAASAAELRLYELINEYRSRLKLHRIPLSPALSFVARTHARDLAENQPYNERCNLHSWSSKGKWTACCYSEGHEQAPCMWKKPAELTSYKAYGYEIAYWNNINYPDPAGIAQDALQAWKKSRGHHAVIINKDTWRQMNWQAVGVGIYKGFVLVWFGTERDP